MWKASLTKHLHFDIAKVLTPSVAEEEVAPEAEVPPAPARPRTSVVIEEIIVGEGAEILSRRKRPRTESAVGPSSSHSSPGSSAEARSEERVSAEVEPTQSEGPTSFAEVNTGIPLPEFNAPLPPRPPRVSPPRGFLKKVMVEEEAELRTMTLPKLSDSLNLATSRVVFIPLSESENVT